MKEALKDKRVLAVGIAGIAIGLFSAYFLAELAFIAGSYKGQRSSERAFNKALEDGFATMPPSEGLIRVH